MSSKQQTYVNDFFQVFAESAVKTLLQNLDKESCKKFEISVKNSSAAQDVETLKEGNAIYKIDYATGTYQSSLAVLIPEELVSSIADIAMGGDGKAGFKGALSELEVNSVTKLFDKIFKDFENNFKQTFSQDLVFSASPQFILKETPDYIINSEKQVFDFLLTCSVALNKEKEQEINVLLNIDILEKVMDDLGLYRSNSAAKKESISKMDIDRLADVKINITAELGRARVPIKYALELVRGSLIELDTLNNADIKVFANGIEFARAQIVAVEEDFGLKITQVISPEERLEYL